MEGGIQDPDHMNQLHVPDEPKKNLRDGQQDNQGKSLDRNENPGGQTTITPRVYCRYHRKVVDEQILVAVFILRVFAQSQVEYNILT